MIKKKDIKILAIDVETTGSDLTKNAMIMLGATLMGLDKKEITSFSNCLKIPKGRGINKVCKREFWDHHKDLFNKIVKMSIKPGDVMNRFSKWLDQIDCKYGRAVVVVSNNPGFDFAWVNLYLSIYTKRVPIYYRKIKSPVGNTSPSSKPRTNTARKYVFRRVFCTNSSYLGCHMTRDNTFDCWVSANKIGFGNGKYNNNHDALEDARKIASDFCNMITKTVN